MVSTEFTFPSFTFDQTSSNQINPDDFGVQLMAASPHECRQRYDDWDRQLTGFYRDYNKKKDGLDDDMTYIRGENVKPEIKIERIASALGKIGPMRQAAERQIQMIDDLLRDCGKDLTDSQKTRLSDIKGQLSGDLNRLKGLEFALPAVRFAIQSGQAIDGLLENLGRLLEGLGSWIPPIPIRLPPIFQNP